MRTSVGLFDVGHNVGAIKVRRLSYCIRELNAFPPCLRVTLCPLYTRDIRAIPQAAQYLQGLASFDLKGLMFGKSAYVPIEGFNLRMARGGYTGEDGFEVRVGCVSARSIVINEMLVRYPFHRHKRSECHVAGSTGESRCPGQPTLESQLMFIRE